MTGEIHDYPTRVLVHSESESGDSYLVDLCKFPVGKVFNGSCLCRHFLYNCEPKLKKHDNQNLYRCKHIRWARENVLDFILPVMKQNDPNIDEDQQT